MSKIKIENFGPIKKGLVDNDGWIEINKVTVFIGNQGSGKSTVAKVISTLIWIEKKINSGEFSEKSWIIEEFKNQFKYHNLETYFNPNTVIVYEGLRYRISYNPQKYSYPEIESIGDSRYLVPKILYVPDSRNFLSVVKNATGVKGLPPSLFDFAEELKMAQLIINGHEIQLPINGVKYSYDRDKDTSFITGADYKVNLLHASSGFQSLVPLYLVASNLAQQIAVGSEISPANISVNQSLNMSAEITSVMLNSKFSDEQKLKEVEKIKAKFQNKSFVNIVEEPEQNLFPFSQKQILYSLLGFNNLNEGNKLIITTHSPYLINYLSLAIKANAVKSKFLGEDVENKLSEIVPLNVCFEAKNLCIYELDEKNGTIEKLTNYNGIPSDSHFLNENIEETNESFSQLLEIEKGWL